jgi:hypothetical protein
MTEFKLSEISDQYVTEITVVVLTYPMGIWAKKSNLHHFNTDCLVAKRKCETRELM